MLSLSMIMISFYLCILRREEEQGDEEEETKNQIWVIYSGDIKLRPPECLGLLCVFLSVKYKKVAGTSVKACVCFSPYSITCFRTINQWKKVINNAYAENGIMFIKKQQPCHLHFLLQWLSPLRVCSSGTPCNLAGGHSLILVCKNTCFAKIS